MISSAKEVINGQRNVSLFCMSVCVGWNLEGGRVCTPMYILAIKLLCGGGPLSHKQGCLIHQFGV